jgi:hypothetical protein
METADAQGTEANSAEDALLGDTARKWPNARSIPVCFLNRNGDEADAASVRSLITSEYQKVGLCFNGWNRCNAATPCPAIRMYIGVPPGADGRWAGQSTVGPASWMCGDTSQWTVWIRQDQLDWASVHEFGHAVGIHHEHARTDNQGECEASKSERIAAGGSIVYYGSYDRSSVMSYCSGRNRLSAADISGLTSFYGTSGATQCTASGGGRIPAGSVKWSYAGPLPNMTCTKIDEPADPHAWGDNFLCSSTNLGLRWSYAGPIAGMTCTQVNEPSDPYTWHDNYLCAPRNLGLRWSYAGPIAGMECVRVNEPSDPHAWGDNYLCYPK